MSWTIRRSPCWAFFDGGRHMPTGHVTVAEVGGRIRAAVGSNGVAISDPFWPTLDLVHMLRVHSESTVRPRSARFARRPVLRRLAGV